MSMAAASIFKRTSVFLIVHLTLVTSSAAQGVTGNGSVPSSLVAAYAVSSSSVVVPRRVQCGMKEDGANRTAAEVAAAAMTAAAADTAAEGNEVALTEGLRLSALCLGVIVLATAVGNILLCLAVMTERRLQNMTNYFLTSLAVCDLLVAVLVMPLGLVVELFGK
jgi:hypothetical protein